jgi:DNA end-binding protein Ku
LINQKRAGKTIAAKPRPRGENVVVSWKRFARVGAAQPAAKVKKPRKALAGQKEMLMPIGGKKPAKQAAKH